MASQLPLTGIIPIVYTPFDESGAIDRQGLHRLVDYLIAAGAHGLAMTGQASETAWLSPNERRSLAEWTAEACGGRVPLIAGVNAGSTSDAITWAQHAVAIGARVVFCGVPSNLSADDDELRLHFFALADAVLAPVMIQNSPTATMSPGFIASLAIHSNIHYVKEESAHATAWTRAIRRLAPGLSVLTGGKHPIADLEAGAVGGIPGSIGVADLVACHNAAVTGDSETAWRRWMHVAPLLYASVGNAQVWAKEILVREGVFATANIRLPTARPFDADDRNACLQLLDRMGPPY